MACVSYIREEYSLDPKVEEYLVVFWADEVVEKKNHEYPVHTHPVIAERLYIHSYRRWFKKHFRWDEFRCYSQDYSSTSGKAGRPWAVPLDN